LCEKLYSRKDYQQGCGPSARPQRTGLLALPHPPHSGDRTLSPPRVSRKREYLRCRPETFGTFARQFAGSEAQRPLAELQKPGRILTLHPILSKPPWKAASLVASASSDFAIRRQSFAPRHWCRATPRRSRGMEPTVRSARIEPAIGPDAARSSHLSRRFPSAGWSVPSRNPVARNGIFGCGDWRPIIHPRDRYCR
jgi:hypothetical protein